MEEYCNNYKNAHGNVDDDDDKGDNNKDTNDGRSDDSMASIASSSPSHCQLVCINNVEIKEVMFFITQSIYIMVIRRASQPRELASKEPGKTRWRSWERECV